MRTALGARSVAELEQNVHAVEARPVPQEILDRLQKIMDASYDMTDSS